MKSIKMAAKKRGKLSLPGEIRRIPKKGKTDYSQPAVEARIQWLRDETGVQLNFINRYSEPTETFAGNIENFIGTAQVPIGIAGPLRVNGDYAKGDYFVPLATTEGVLVNSFHRGARLITKAGGANVKIFKKEMHVTPALKVDSLRQAIRIIGWIKNNFEEIKKIADSTTSHGKLINIYPRLVGRLLLLKMCYDTKDAMGMNMITIASDAAVKLISEENKIKVYYPRSNYSSDKKNSSHNYIEGYGRSIHAEAVIPANLIRYFGTTAEEMFEYFNLQLQASVAAGMHGVNGQFANGIAALFIATGQDVAQVINSAVGMSICEPKSVGGLYISVDLPNLLVGTIGGGTRRGYAKESLSIMDCCGLDNADKFAEIVTATVLAGELSILGALASGTFVDAHRSFGRPSKFHNAP